MGHVFISYSHQDQAVVDAIVEKLEAAGLDVWIDREGIKPGKQWRMQIVKAIDTADSFVLKLSPTAAESVNVRKELDLAEDSPDPFVLPVLLAEVKIPAEMRYQLAGTQWIEYYLDPDNKYRQLEDTLVQRRAQKTTPPPTQKEAEIVIKGSALADFDDEMKAKLLAFLAENTGASIEDLTVTRVEAGSLHVFVQLPADPAYELKAMALNNDQRLVDAGITGLRFVGDKNIIPVSSTPAPTTGASRLPGKLVSRIVGGVIGLAVVAALVYGALNLDSIFLGATPTPTKPTPTATIVIPSPTGTPEPSRTPSDTPTNTSTHTITTTLSPTSTRTKTTPAEPPMAIAQLDTFCRSGPGANYARTTASMLKGEEAPIIQISQDGFWVQTELDKYGSPIRCWVSTGEGGTVDVAGDTSPLPVFIPPPTPTNTVSPTSTATPPPPEDNTPPSAPMPQDPPDGHDVDCAASVTLTWSTVSDESGIAVYYIKLEEQVTESDWQPVGGYTSSTNTIDVPIDCGIYYRWMVRAEDGAGNLSAWSSFSYFGVYID